MKGTFKESEIEIEVIDLSEGRNDKPVCVTSRVLDKSFFSPKNFEKEIVNTIVDEIHKKEDEQTVKDLVAQNKAMKTSIALLEKCLDEATEDRDRYKRQLDELNIMFDKYIRREKKISPSSHKSCCMCKYYNLRGCQCRCKLSDNYNEITDLGYSCERFEEE